MRLLIVAFPGIGKTTLVKEVNKKSGYDHRQGVDFDYKSPNPIPESLRKAHSGVVKIWFDQPGVWLVTSFLPWLNPDSLPPDLTVISATPDPKYWVEHIEKVRKRDEKGDQTWLAAVQKHGETWLANWIKQENNWRRRFKDFRTLRLRGSEYLSMYVPIGDDGRIDLGEWDRRWLEWGDGVTTYDPHLSHEGSSTRPNPKGVSNEQ